MTDVSGNVADSLDFLPFGEQIAGDTFTTHKFTGKERDAETGNDYFGARYNSSSMGRFISPDPAGLLAVNPINPQSWNLYSYVLNDPMSLIDPTGLDPGAPCIVGVDRDDNPVFGFCASATGHNPGSGNNGNGDNGTSFLENWGWDLGAFLGWGVPSMSSAPPPAQTPQTTCGPTGFGILVGAQGSAEAGLSNEAGAGLQGSASGGIFFNIQNIANLGASVTGGGRVAGP